MITVEIWSDFSCPFCYIGKRRFEEALSHFPHKDGVSVVWKSFELDPYARRDPGMSIHDLLAQKYGQTRQWAVRMNEQVTRMAATSGLTYDLERAIPTNTFDAHRLSHLAAKHGLQDKAEEKLFAAYFTEGKHIGDAAALAALAGEIGIDPEEAKKALAGKEYADAVREDEAEGERRGLNVVPTFVFNGGSQVVSGAQAASTFLNALEQAHKEALAVK